MPRLTRSWLPSVESTGTNGNESGLAPAEQYARLFVQLKRAGTPVPDNDLWIAALALQHDLVLISRDRHFTFIPQLLQE